MLDAVQSRLDGVLHGPPGAAVRRRQGAEPVRRVDGGAQLLHRVRRVLGRRPGGSPARCHDLDVIGALRDEPPDRLSDPFGAVRLTVAPVEVAAAVRHRTPAQEQAWSDDIAPSHGLPDGERDAVATSVVAQRGHPGGKVGAQVPHRYDRHELVGVGDHVFVGPAFLAHLLIAREGEMAVCVDEPRQQGRVGMVHVGFRSPRHGAEGLHGRDPTPLDRDEGILEHHVVGRSREDPADSDGVRGGHGILHLQLFQSATTGVRAAAPPSLARRTRRSARRRSRAR